MREYFESRHKGVKGSFQRGGRCVRRTGTVGVNWSNRVSQIKKGLVCTFGNRRSFVQNLFEAIEASLEFSFCYESIFIYRVLRLAKYCRLRVHMAVAGHSPLSKRRHISATSSSVKLSPKSPLRNSSTSSFPFLFLSSRENALLALIRCLNPEFTRNMRASAPCDTAVRIVKVRAYM